jgi:hypothetical protein
VKNIDKLVGDDSTLHYFFNGKGDYIKELAQKAADFENDPSTLPADKSLLPKLIKVSLYKQVVYCGKCLKIGEVKCNLYCSFCSSADDDPIDDSSSMRTEGRWDIQKEFVKRIVKVTTRILPEGEGVTLRFINQNSTPTFKAIKENIDALFSSPNGSTNIGTGLRSKVLEPLVYSKIIARYLERPLLITILTDGSPYPEYRSKLFDTISECGRRLRDAGYPPQSAYLILNSLPSFGIV